MIISDAVKKAIDENGFITIPEFDGIAKIKPTSESCVVMDWDGSRLSKSGWQPTTEQITRDDWIVVYSKEVGSEKPYNEHWRL